MALHMILVMLSLLPLLEAQNPEHVNITIGEPITNETLSWLSDKWFFIGAAVLNPDYRQEIQKMQMVFFNITPNLINDTMELREYHTIDDHCVYNSTHLGIQRENGTLSKYVGGVKIFADLIVLRKHGAFMLAFDLKDEKKRGLSLNAKRPDITPELREVFQKAVKHVGMDESEIIFVDWKKDKCGQQEKKQLELEKETKKDPEEGQA
uniref:Alpha-1-acid glycoprotein 1 n=1 Tax=Mus caroli TaxID=10089 RepID=A1AG1_MUSCR|nr:RecName: Full=Alpha-1-acid glycoprotein 1; Short=AGP 1; AltName: Full=Orosomucoid-1; Short=OMD 1; Flags: Precursor [Mus caroli]AAA37195.1 alpha-1-acid glycoprotein (AGP) precursor [Mus caroli]